MEELILQEQNNIAVSNVFSSREAFQALYDIAKVFAASNLVPQNYQNRPQDCVIAIDMANRMGISPMMVMQNLYVVKGKPSWSGQACMTLISGSGKYKDIRPVYTGEKGTESRGCYIKAIRISDNEVVEGTEITMSMVNAEGWLSNTKWRNMPEQMLAYRAAAFFARVYCPETLMGVQLADEVIDIAKEKKETPVNVFGGIEDENNE